METALLLNSEAVPREIMAIIMALISAQALCCGQQSVPPYNICDASQRLTHEDA